MRRSELLQRAALVPVVAGILATAAHGQGRTAGQGTDNTVVRAGAESHTGRGIAPMTSTAQPTGERASSVMLLPFVNISGTAADDWFGAGIVETLAVSLQEADVLVVRVDMAPGAVDAAAHGSRNARWFVTGSYQRQGARMRITARVVEVVTGAVMQTSIVDGLATELFNLQDRLVADLGPSLSEAAARARTPDIDGPAPSGVVERPAESAVPEAAGHGGLAPVAERPARSTGDGGQPAQPAASDSRTTPRTLAGGPPPPEPPATISRDALGRATLRAARLADPLRVDGVLDEAVYETVLPFGGFLQQVPVEGAPSTERTDAWVFYDGENVYVSARLWDSAPESRWIANEMRRDSFQLIQNDYFSAAFDTFHDRRNGFGFMINPLGGFLDFEITDEGNPNLDWNPVWDSSVGRFDGGWAVEMAIPFKSIRFRPGAEQQWGLQLGRSIRWKNETAYLNPVPISGGPGEFRVSAAATLTGMDVPGGNRTFDVKPYAIGGLATDVAGGIRSAGTGDYGIDAKYGVTENLTADFTYNTDFAQVEVDEQQVNLTRFSLFFPEKRDFFLESRGIFDFGRGAVFGGGVGPGAGRLTGGTEAPILFFSRRIGLEQDEQGVSRTVPIIGGARLTGRVGRFAVGALGISTGRDEAVGAQPTTFSVLRISRDILRRSRIGGLYTGRSVSLSGQGSNEVYGADAQFAFFDNVYGNGYYARSRTTGREGDDASYQGVLTYNGDLFAVQLDHLRVGANFNPEMGFLQRRDFRRTFATANFGPRPRSIEAIRQFTFGGTLDYIETGTGAVETRVAQLRFQTEFENSDRLSLDVQSNYEFIPFPFRLAPDVFIAPGPYDFQDVFLSYSLGAQRRVSGTLSLQRGGFYDGNLTALGYGARAEVTPQLSFEPAIYINRIEVSSGMATIPLVRSRVTYTLTPRLFFGGLIQYNSIAASLGTNLRLRWEYQPGSELFVVYNDTRDTSLRGRPLLENRAFIVKLTRLFRF